MIRLIILENDKPVYNPEIRAFRPFLNIIVRDNGRTGTGFNVKGDINGRNKIFAMLELAFIYWHRDPRSSYWEKYADEKDRTERLKVVLGLPEEWKIDEVVKKGMDFYDSLIKDDFDIEFLKAALNAAEKVKGYYEEVDFSIRDDKGNFLYKIKEVNAALKDAGGVIESLNTLRKKVSKGEVLNKKIRGGGTINEFEE